MSLTTDLLFFNAIKSNATLMEAISNRLYNTAIPLPDDDADNVPAPYVILTFDGLQNDQSSKDGYESEDDAVTISILVVATDRPSLGELTNAIRTTIREYFENVDPEDEDDEAPYDYQFSASQVAYDSSKPAHFQTLTYQCDTNR